MRASWESDESLLMSLTKDACTSANCNHGYYHTLNESCSPGFQQAWVVLIKEPSLAWLYQFTGAFVHDWLIKPLSWQFTRVVVAKVSVFILYYYSCSVALYVPLSISVLVHERKESFDALKIMFELEWKNGVLGLFYFLSKIEYYVSDSLNNIGRFPRGFLSYWKPNLSLNTIFYIYV